MPSDRETLAERLRDRIDSLGRKPRDVSMSATGKPDLVRDIFRLKRMPTAPIMQQLAAELGTTTEYLLGQTENPQQVLSEVAIADNRLDYMTRSASRSRPEDTPGIPLVGTGDCADLEVIDDDGHDITIERSSFDADYQVRMIDRPPALRGARHAYAIYFQGSSMEPRFFAGEIGIVDPDRPAAPGDFVLVQLNNGEEDHVVSVLVKRLIRQTSAYLELEQFNPATVFKIDKNKVARVHKIMPPTDLLFR